MSLRDTSSSSPDLWSEPVPALELMAAAKPELADTKMSLVRSSTMSHTLEIVFKGNRGSRLRALPARQSHGWCYTVEVEGKRR
jgi:hypothetical protein